MDERDLELVKVAFERLHNKVYQSGCDLDTVRTIYFAQVDILAILNGEWDNEYGPLNVVMEVGAKNA